MCDCRDLKVSYIKKPELMVASNGSSIVVLYRIHSR